MRAESTLAPRPSSALRSSTASLPGPGAGKSVGLNDVVAHAALSLDADLWFFDCKLVELGLWRSCAERFVGNDLGHALGALAELTAEMDRRYDLLDVERRRKVTLEDADRHGVRPAVVVVDGLAYCSTTVGTKQPRRARRRGA